MIQRLLIFILILFFSSCLQNPDKDLDVAINNYKNGPIKNVAEIGKKFLNLIKKKEFNSKDLMQSNNVLFTIDNEAIHIHHPVRLTVKLLQMEKPEIIDINKNYLVLSDKNSVNILNNELDLIKSLPVGDKKKRIKAVKLINDKIIYYFDGRVFEYSIKSGEHGLLIKNRLKSPYKKHYEVKIFKKGTFVGVLIGIAGSYYYNIINYNKRLIAVQNLSVSSKKMLLTDKYLDYVFGSSGKWVLKRFKIAGKSKESLYLIYDIIDIELLTRGIIFENSSGLWMREHSKGNIKSEKMLIPFKYRLTGKCDNLIILQYNSKSYLVDFERLNAKLKILKSKIPKIGKVKK